MVVGYKTILAGTGNKKHGEPALCDTGESLVIRLQQRAPRHTVTSHGDVMALMARLRVASIFVTYMSLGLARHDSATSVASHCRGNALLIRHQHCMRRRVPGLLVMKSNLDSVENVRSIK